MKKLFLTLIALVATSLASFSQVSLYNVYEHLADQSGMKAKEVGTISIDGVSNIIDAQAVTGSAAKARQFQYAVESLPSVNMILGASNQKEMAVAFTEQPAGDIFNVLFLFGTKGGKYTAVYGQTDAAGIDAISNSEVSMQGGELVIAPAPQIELVEVITAEVIE